MSLLFLFLSLLLAFPSPTTSFDIAKILAQNPSFSTFNNYLAQTQLAPQINSRETITVLAVDNRAMSSISGKSMDTIKKILSIHVILDYYDATKLQHLNNKSLQVTTLFQTTGQASNQEGFLNVTISENGVVSFVSASQQSSGAVNFINSVASEPYDISVIQVSSLIIPSTFLTSPDHSSSPSSSPSPDIPPAHSSNSTSPSPHSPSAHPSINSTSPSYSPANSPPAHSHSPAHSKSPVSPSTSPAPQAHSKSPSTSPGSPPAHSKSPSTSPSHSPVPAVKAPVPVASPAPVSVPVASPTMAPNNADTPMVGSPPAPNAPGIAPAPADGNTAKSSGAPASFGINGAFIILVITFLCALHVHVMILPC